MSKKLYVIADIYFEDAVFATYEIRLVKKFMQYPCRKLRYDVLEITDKNLRKEFERLYMDGESYVETENHLLTTIEYETYINTIPTTLISVEGGISKIIDCLDFLKLDDDERKCIDECLSIVYKMTRLYFDEQVDILDHDKFMYIFIEEERV